MMKYILMFLLAYSVQSYAIDTGDIANAGFSNLTATQQAELIKQIETMKGQNEAHKADVSVEKLDEWVSLGDHIGKAMAGSAREMGIAVNEFAGSPVGKIVLFLIIWKMFGGMAVHVLMGLFINIMVIGMILWHARKAREIAEVYSPEKTNLFGNPVLVSREMSKIGDEYSVTYLVVGVLSLFVSIIVTFTW